jgi:hypothetical protein
MVITIIIILVLVQIKIKLAKLFTPNCILVLSRDASPRCTKQTKRFSLFFCFSAPYYPHDTVHWPAEGSQGWIYHSRMQSFGESGPQYLLGTQGKVWIMYAAASLSIVLNNFLTNEATIMILSLCVMALRFPKVQIEIPHV